ncbi:MAG: type II toxin-antitoxin system HipA family toxin [Acidimicrobiia bacterium]
MIHPSEAKRIDSADVYKGERLAGRLVRTAQSVEYRYDAEYLADGSPSVATTLPLRIEPYRTGSGSLPPFFTGLLPEGARLQAVVSAVKTSVDDELSLLLAVGSDTVGDVRVVPSGEVPVDPLPNLPTDPSEVRFADLLHQATSPSADQLDRALPGVQNKISDAMISFPIRSDRRPAILKLDPDRFPLITRNEAFFLSLARTAGFRVPDHQLISDSTGETGLLVGRFDRESDPEGRPVRIGQEDGCQLLGRYPADKYRITMNDLASIVSATASASRVAVLDLTLQFAFSWMIGNGDLHAKNYSLQWRDGSTLVTATPVYDLVSTLPYPLDQRSAMQLDGRDANFRIRYLTDFAERWGVPGSLARRKINEIADRTEPDLDELGSIGYDDPTTERLSNEIRRRIDALRSG